MKPIRISLVVLAAALAACRAEAPAPAPSATAGTNSPQAAAATTAANAGLRDADRRERPGRWWKQPELVERLGIDATQQAAMDAIVEQAQASYAEHARALRDARRQYQEAIAKGDLVAARAAAEARAHHAEQRARVQQLVPVDLLERLDPQQRRIALQEYAKRVQRSVVRGPEDGARGDR